MVDADGNSYQPSLRLAVRPEPTHKVIRIITNIFCSAVAASTHLNASTIKTT